MPTRPTVTIGLPVYNGANYLADALDALLGQTFEDFELIISDNASTDATAAICQRYAAQDRRIRYVRNERNVGAAANFNKVFQLADSPYFKWAAHDDIIDPELLECCIYVLEQDSSIVLTHTRVRFIDENGEFFKRSIGGASASSRYRAAPKNQESVDPIARFKAILSEPAQCFEVFGIARTSALRRSSLIGSYYGSDRVLIAELSLYGRFHQIDDELFFQRCHSDQSSTKASPQELERWISGRRPRHIVSPQWHMLTGYLRALMRAPLSPIDRLRGVGVVARRATQPDKLKRLIVPGPHNYFGIGARRKLSSKS